MQDISGDTQTEVTEELTGAHCWAGADKGGRAA